MLTRVILYASESFCSLSKLLAIAAVAESSSEHPVGTGMVPNSCADQIQSLFSGCRLCKFLQRSSDSSKASSQPKCPVGVMTSKLSQVVDFELMCRI